MASLVAMWAAARSVGAALLTHSAASCFLLTDGAAHMPGGTLLPVASSICGSSCMVLCGRKDESGQLAAH